MRVEEEPNDGLSPPPLQRGRVREGVFLPLAQEMVAKMTKAKRTKPAKQAARRLRKQPTDSETKLWSRLRRRQVGNIRFRRQSPIGPYVVDFVCAEIRLIVEVDGGQHSWREAQDARRTEWLESQGYRLIRFWDNEVNENIEGVLEKIVLVATETPPPRPSPSEEGEGEDTRRPLKEAADE
jgi:very-short-patch-repair endonuclease